MGKPILCVDFDGVIHSYESGWKGATVIPDPPTKGALRWLWKATEWWDVQVYSSRSKDPEAREAMLQWMVKHSLIEFGEDHPMSRDDDESRANYPVTFAYEKPAAFLTIDDRAVCFEGDWNELDAYDLTHFKPWNKRPQLGATGTFSQGSLGPHDEGDIKMGVAHDSNGLVHMNFGKDISWFAVPPEQAIELGKLLMRHAGAKKIEVTL